MDIVDQRPALKNGAIVWCDLGLGSAEHTGIYIGDNRIIELNGDGYLRKLSLNEFVNCSDYRTGISLYSLCDVYGEVLSDSLIAYRANKFWEEKEKRGYNLLFDNCHQFTAGCITGNLVNPFKTFESLKVLIIINFNRAFITSRVVY
jgi:hypothetical protein